MIDRLWRAGLWLAYRGMRAYWFWVRPTEPSVHVAVWCADRILVVRNSYRRGLGLPAGRARRRADPAAEAARELREEVGIDVPPAALRSAGEWTSRADHKLDVARYFEVDFEVAPAVEIDRREVIWAGFVAVSDALDEDLRDTTRAYLTARRA